LRAGCVAVCAIISSVAAAQPAPSARAPILAVLDPADAEQWRAWSAARGFRVVAPPAAPGKSLDQRVLDLRSAVEAAAKEPGADPARVYLAGRGDAASGVFYAACRTPDVWSAAVALGGSPQAAIDTNRFYAANFTILPVLWVSNTAGDDALAKRLRSAGMNLELRSASGLSADSVLDWLLGKRREEFPASVDCETSSPAFATCFWIRLTKFDPASRNDVLGSTRQQPRSGASLDLGGFGYKTDDPGPGILVNWLPDKYNGPLKMNDRIVALGGKPLKDAGEYAEVMEKTVEEKPVVAAVQRGNDRVRLETRIVLPRREESVTARVQGKYSAEEKEVQIVSRTVTEMRVTAPEAWAGAALNWNGTVVAKTHSGGCWLLVEKDQLQSAKMCP
jgi:hypothetical protein